MTDRMWFYVRDVGINAKDEYCGMKRVKKIDIVIRKQCQFAFVYMYIEKR